MIKTFHEAPKSIFSVVQTRTHGDYALVHLLEQDPEYAELFLQAKKDGREIILDNSIFELGEAFDTHLYVKWIETLQPDWYILPDSLENSLETREKAGEWVKQYPHLGGKKIGVVQGKTLEELVECYRYMTENIKVDKVAISFDYSYYQKSFPHPNKWVSYMMGRVKFIGDLTRSGVFKENIPLHLLGVALPQEGLFYRNYDFIDSVDTSNPVVHGIKGYGYEKTGLWKKETQMLHTLINHDCDAEDFQLITENIMDFNSYWNA